MVALTADAWLAHRLNAHLNNPHEYRATTANLLRR